MPAIVVSRTQGQQKIARSELYAVLLIVETFPAAEIYSDSQTTIDRFHTCQDDKDPLTWIDSDDMDLLLRLQKAVGSRHRIHKVAAHVDPQFTSNDLDCYRQLGNMVANDSAIKVVGPCILGLSKLVFPCAMRYKSQGLC